MNNRVFSFASAGLCVVCAAAGLRVAGAAVPGAPFAHNMVLQRGMKVPVWGTAAAGERVKVSFAGQNLETAADAKGAWRVNLAPMEASREPRELVIAAGADAALVITNVLVGEVWFASGQSNMEVPLWGYKPHFRDRDGAMMVQMLRRPLIRFANSNGDPNWVVKWDVEPQSRPIGEVTWRPVAPESFRKYAFSAVALYYALELYHALEIPVGIVGGPKGGTRLEPWIPRGGIESVPELKELREWKVVASAEWKPEFAKQCPRGAGQQPTVLYNAMIAPWAPMAMRGFIWYQGCSGGGPGPYDKLMHALYNGWAAAFENPALKLYLVQVCNNGNNAVKEAQAKFAAEEPNAAVAVISDLGNPDDIHPSEKQPVARRLALHALKNDYGFPNIEADSPTVRSWKVADGAFVLEFDHAKRLYVYNDNGSYDAPFEIAGSDGRFQPARIVNITDYRRDKTRGKPNTLGNIDEPRLVVRADGVAEPKAIRYLYRKPWKSSVYNQVCLPLGSFSITVK